MLGTGTKKRHRQELKADDGAGVMKKRRKTTGERKSTAMPQPESEFSGKDG